MKERPILFSGPMVRAILDGHKTQTRRVFKLPSWAEWDNSRGLGEQTGDILPKDPSDRGWYNIEELACPHGAVGDRLWVRESGVISKLLGTSEKPGLFRHDVPTTPEIGHYWVEETRAAGASYNVAGCSRANALLNRGAKACPSIHMPRWACRLELDITGVRVERLQDICEADAAAEGIELYRGPLRRIRHVDVVTGEASHNTARDAFFSLWEHLNGAASVAVNPWVWVIEFQRVERVPVDVAAELSEDDVPF